MAIMIPAVIYRQTVSPAEKLLFPILRDRLNNSFMVFHSFNTLTASPEDKLIEGEIDFLIVSPEHGVLVLEVKGGAIAYDGIAGVWLQNNHPLEDSPFVQALHSKYKLRDYLQSKLRHVPQCAFAHAVCFPDVYSEMPVLPAEASRAICITGLDLPRLEDKVKRAMAAFAGPSIAPSPAEFDKIRRILMPLCEYGARLRDKIGQAEPVMFRLTENQCRFLDYIREHREALVRGCAGSGKTVMAVKKARELAAGGKSVLLLCYNRMLGELLADAVKDYPEITAATYHDFCLRCLREAGQSPPDTGTEDYWNQRIPEAFSALMRERPVKFDALIIDEGQDFRMEYWVTVADLVKPEGYFYIFYDPDQNLWGNTLDFPIKKEPFILSDNCRNSKMILSKLKE